MSSSHHHNASSQRIHVIITSSQRIHVIITSYKQWSPGATHTCHIHVCVRVPNTLCESHIHHNMSCMIYMVYVNTNVSQISCVLIYIYYFRHLYYLYGVCKHKCVSNILCAHLLSTIYSFHASHIREQESTANRLAAYIHIR